MPRRVSSVTFARTEIFKPFWQRRGMSPMAVDCEATHEILEIFHSKNSCVGSPAFGCSPPYFSGSPPSRAGNPVVRDKEFSHQNPSSPTPTSVMVAPREAALAPAPQPVAAPQVKPVTPPTYRASPCVRVEGFDCSGRGFECTGREARCHVSAIA